MKLLGFVQSTHNDFILIKTLVRIGSVSIYYRLIVGLLGFRPNLLVLHILIVGLLGFRPNLLVLHILVLHTPLCLYKGSLCINLITEHNIQSYFAHIQSLFFLPLLIL